MRARMERVPTGYRATATEDALLLVLPREEFSRLESVRYRESNPDDIEPWRKLKSMGIVGSNAPAAQESCCHRGIRSGPAASVAAH